MARLGTPGVRDAHAAKSTAVISPATRQVIWSQVPRRLRAFPAPHRRAVFRSRNERSMRFQAAPDKTFDLLVALCSLWIACGFFLDAWAHGHVPVETFFTPYHAAFYSGMLALVVVLGIFGIKNGGFPPSYRVALLGIPIFIACAVGDLFWHRVFGVEQGVDALLSPTHQGLGLGVFFIASGPISAALARREAVRTLAAQMPVLASLACWMELVHFGTAYAFDPAAGRTNAPPSSAVFSPDYLTALALGYYKLGMGVLVVIFQSALMAACALYASSRFALAPGALTITFVLGNTAAAAAFTNDTPLLITVVAMSVIAGIAGDVLVARLRPSPERPATFRALGIIVPLTYFATYVVLSAVFTGIWWDWNVVLGAVLWAGVTGLALALLAFPG